MWEEIDSKLTKSYKFDDFKSALAFVNKVGELAEQANHHPDIELSWGKVVINLSTHETNSVTEKDTKLADQIDKL